MSSQPAASPEPARVVVLGAGWWTQGWHCPHLSRHPHAIIAAVVDTSPTPRSAISELESLEALGARYGCPTFSSFDAVLEASVVFDGVIVCTSHASHAALGQRALAAGKHVLMEKPMTTDVEEARALAAAAAARPELFFAVNNTASWRPQAHAAAAWVKAGSVGRVRHVACVMHSPLLWLFDDPANVGWTKPTGSMRGNGFAWGQLSHLLAWVLQVTGLEPAKVSCTMTFSEASGADLNDAAVFRCVCGASISLTGSGAVPGNAHEDVGGDGGENHPHAGKHVSVRVFGDDGSLVYEGDDQDPSSGDLVLLRRDGGRETVKEFLFENYEAEGTGPESVQAFLGACRGLAPGPPGVDAAVGLDVVRCISGMYDSAVDHGGAQIPLA
mmetsp:Transcript_25358/g.79122  ORF Transcript_25358/g.79122 Transcript_25358/m.79122 type:complete len:385 (+) Transcript_25358:231-1385(+)